MIITRLEANNVLKYQKLVLKLPQKGLIAISGQNESGKSSIGEAVCFALFGRTFSVGSDDLQKVVRWGENHCVVTLDFRVGDQAYTLSRFLDRDGNHSAKLSHFGEEEPIARGVSQVSDVLIGLLGFEYEQFVESFYLAQREITTPHPHSQAVKIMAGVAPLEKVADEIEDEIGEREDLLEEVEVECDALREELEDLGVQEGHLQQLEEQRLETLDQSEQMTAQVAEMSDRLGVYERNTRLSHKADQARSRASFFRFIFLLLALVAGAAWWLLTEGAGTSVGEQFPIYLDQYIPQWKEVQVEWILWAAGGFSALFMLMWIRVASKKAGVRRLRAEAGQLAESLQAAREFDFEIEQEAEAAPPATVDEEGTDDDPAPEEPAAAPLPVRPDAVELNELLPKVADGTALVRQVSDYTHPEMAWLDYVRELLAAQVVDLDEAIVAEQERLKQHRNLLEVQAGIRAKRDEVESRIDLRRKAQELLRGAIAHLSNNFNRDIKDLVARMLPRFTDERYEHLQIDQDLRVRVFSAEKRDFMVLEEVSSGTQRQIMLALRLALSQKLLSRKIKGQQFAFLDEPFAFFDEERTRKALAALADLGEDISQVWIVAQSFPQESAVAFDAHITCERGSEQLILET